ncbi:hypothetical protein PTSG_09782 [Salpingoeca rosetta]|uniref:Uncharacterized protein n=1 Tax=Salpingoeca rosetta (strain ATCC 50818 / BSB-021) TaxID=946362 RepID=F2UP17_SALR5|nr:uncharacterized protein PTSG_09782 [Salpingoeca rosetta]EGD79372.1 hypothetical protein PTSG_09782 [Salpingoeca rosetta]|eukprot:XP_004989141.1 hypothetical protein PTSG_09782 [Salpingoeca rosetta]
MVPRRVGISTRLNTAFVVSAVLVTAHVGILLLSADNSAGAAVLEEDDAGSLHISTNDPARQPVFMNGMDVAHLFQLTQEQQRAIAKQRRINAAQDHAITSIAARLRALEQPSSESMSSSSSSPTTTTTTVHDATSSTSSSPTTTTTVHDATSSTSSSPTTTTTVHDATSSTSSSPTTTTTVHEATSSTSSSPTTTSSSSTFSEFPIQPTRN